MGRPSKYKPEFAQRVKMLCASGATLSDLATAFGVSVSTVKLWALEHKAFSAAQKVGKATADRLVEESLFRRAMGYETDETDIRVVGTKLVKTQIRRHYQPDTTACIFWLKNRKPKEWRDRQQHELTGAEGRTLAQELASMPKDSDA